MQRNTLLGCVIVAAGLATGVAAPRAWAQCDVYRLGIPDFDQRRSTLPGGGNMYCVTTSGMNWLAYIANHGYPLMLDGPRAWQSQANYDHVSNMLEIMGAPVLMNTTTDNGTTWGGYRNGMQIWMDSWHPDAFSVSVAGSNGQWVPTPNQLAFLEASNCLVSIAHGRYTLDTCGSNPTQFRRTGGHCVSLARVYDGCSDSPEVWYRDPAGFDGDNTSQAQFVTQSSDYAQLTANFGSCSATPVNRTMWRRLTSNPDTYSILDGYGWIVAMEGLTADAELGTVSVLGTWDFNDFSVPPVRTFNLPQGHIILDLQYDLMSPAPIVLSRNGPEHVVWRIDRGGGRPQRVATFSQPIEHLVIGRRNDAYMWQQLTPTAGRLIRMDLDSAAILDTLPLDSAPQAVAYDDEADGIVLVTGDGSGVGCGRHDFDDYIDDDLPAGVGPIHGGASIVAASRLGRRVEFAVCGEGIEGVALLGRGPNGELRAIERIVHPDLERPSDLRVTPRGTVVCNSGGEIKAVEFDSDRDEWVASDRFPLAGRPVGDFLRIVDSRVNAGEWFDTDADVNIDPSEVEPGEGVPDCDADFNGDLVVNSQDFFDFLTRFFEASPLADFNQNGELNSQDFFDFLTAFFAGCR